MPGNRQAEVGTAKDKSHLPWDRLATVASAVWALLMCLLFAISVLSVEYQKQGTPPGGYGLDGPGSRQPIFMDQYVAFAILLLGALLALRKSARLPLLLAWLAILGCSVVHSLPIVRSMLNNGYSLQSLMAMIAEERGLQVWVVGFLLALAGFALRGKQWGH